MSQNMCLINVNGENLSKVDMFTEDRLIQEWETEIKSIQIPLQHIVWIRRIFSTLLNIYDGVFQQKLYTRKLFLKKDSIADIWQNLKDFSLNVFSEAYMLSVGIICIFAKASNIIALYFWICLIETFNDTAASVDLIFFV